MRLPFRRPLELHLLSRLSTGGRMFVILTLALLPLGIVALLASLQAGRTADLQRRADLRVAIGESTRKLGSELAADQVVLAQALQMLADDPTGRQSCQRADALIRSGGRRDVAFSIFGAGATPLCTTRGTEIRRPSTRMIEPQTKTNVEGDALVMTVPSRSGDAVAVAHYPAHLLADFARPGGFAGEYSLSLDVGGETMPLESRLVRALFDRAESVSSAIGFPGVSLTMTVRSVPFGATEALLAFLPLLMWASAALVGFYVVDKLLIVPLETLRRSIAAYVPGQPLSLPHTTPAVEIRELGTTFVDVADRLSQRDSELEAALADQVKLTREVHHRVKNNLQVIASLISLHARGKREPAVLAAYAQIQRRVDALAIVHRNHFAELEHNRGIEVRALLSEIGANFRNGAGPRPPTVSVASASLCVVQDIATPLAFLVTELAEWSLELDAAATITIAAEAVDDERARLSIASRAFIASGAPEEHRDTTTMRIVEGLARQLRTPLDYDADAHSYGILFPIQHRTSA